MQSSYHAVEANHEDGAPSPVAPSTANHFNDAPSLERGITGTLSLAKLSHRNTDLGLLVKTKALDDVRAGQPFLAL